MSLTGICICVAKNSVKVKARQAGKEDVFISLFDLERIYAPDFKVVKKGGAFSVIHVGITVKAITGKKRIDVASLGINQ